MEMTATEFKAKCLEILDRVNETGESVTITKRGRVVAELIAPSNTSGQRPGPGSAKGQMRILGDIMAPLDIEWDALK